MRHAPFKARFQRQRAAFFHQPVDDFRLMLHHHIRRTLHHRLPLLIRQPPPIALGGFGGLSRCGNIAAIGIADSAQHLTGGHFHRFSALRSGLPLPVEKLALPKGLII